MRRIEEGCKKYPKEEYLRQVLADVMKEYLGIAVPKPIIVPYEES